MQDSYSEAIGYRNGKVALRQDLRGLRPGLVNLDDLHRNTVQAEVHCTGVTYSKALPNLFKLTIVVHSHDECVRLPTATSDLFPQLEELHVDNTGDFNSTDHALEWDLRAMPSLKQVACDSLNNSLEWDLHQLPKLQRVFCGSTRLPKMRLPSRCKADLELQLFMQQTACDPQTSLELQPWSCIDYLHLDRLAMHSSLLSCDYCTDFCSQSTQLNALSRQTCPVNDEGNVLELLCHVCSSRAAPANTSWSNC